MRILLLTQVVPAPPDSGPRVKTGLVIRYLVARGHEVTLATFVRPEERRHLTTLAGACASIHAVALTRSRRRDLAAWLRSHWRRRPFLVARDDDPVMRAMVHRLLASRRFDAVHADQLSMAQFVGADVTGIQSVFDAHNAMWRLAERMRGVAPRFLRSALAQEVRRLRQYEGETVSRFDQTLAVSEADRQALGAAVGDTAGAGRIRVVPIGIDTGVLRRAPRPAASTEILTLGALRYWPNLDGIRWLARDVLPLVRRDVSSASLTIVGSRPSRDLTALARRQPVVVRVTGHVPDVTPYFERAAVVAVPVRAGSGMRVRILEAFARGVPVVTTTVGLEGIDAEPGRDVLVADTAGEMADAVVRVLRDPALAADLAMRGRRLAEARYDWRIALAGLDRVYPVSRQAPA